jgi:hypothetical protein
VGVAPECLVDHESGDERTASLSFAGAEDGGNSEGKELLPCTGTDDFQNPSGSMWHQQQCRLYQAAHAPSPLPLTAWRCNACKFIRLKNAGQVASVLYLNDGHFRHKKPWRGAGLAIPVFSIRTKDSVGCGDFIDVKKMVDFVAACGMHVLQVCVRQNICGMHVQVDAVEFNDSCCHAATPLYQHGLHNHCNRALRTLVASMFPRHCI